jgi:hypothetical protein
MCHTENIFAYSKLAEKINRKYAKRHGYDFKILQNKMSDRAQQWCKVEVINQILSENKYDYIMWIDADAFFNDQSVKIEKFINMYPEKDILVCDDIPNSGKENTINSGTLILKCSPWTKQFCKDWWDYKGKYSYEYFHEQSVMEDYITRFPDNFKVFPANTFNSAVSNIKETDYVIHLMSMSPEYRIQRMAKWPN